MADFEHAIFMLLLLVGIFNAWRPGNRRVLAFLVGGILLALLPPFIKLSIPWELFLFLTIPLLFWQNARRWLHARWTVDRGELALWLLTAGLLVLVLSLSGYLSWTGMLLFGIVAASILWRAFEPEGHASTISQIGPLTLVFLLTEAALAVETPNMYLGGLFSGAAIGLGVALISIPLYQRSQVTWKVWIGLAQAYLAYLLAALVDVSAVTAALIATVVFAEVSLRRGLIDERGLQLPAPISYWPVFSALLGLFVFLGWQAHQPFQPFLLLEALLGLVIGLGITWAGQRLNVSGFESWKNVSGIERWSRLFVASSRIGLFLFVALLLWPRTVLLEPVPLAVALGLSVLTVALAMTLLPATRSLQEP